MSKEKIVQDIFEELDRAIDKFPFWPDDIIHAATVVSEESGELAKASLQVVYEPDKSTIEDCRNEAIQTAAMAIRYIISLDAELYCSTDIQHSQDVRI